MPSHSLPQGARLVRVVCIARSKTNPRQRYRLALYGVPARNGAAAFELQRWEVEFADGRLWLDCRVLEFDPLRRVGGGHTNGRK
jgi:hypothetical protein